MAVDVNLLAHVILRTRIGRGFMARFADKSPGFSLIHKIRCMGEGRRADRKHQDGSEDSLVAIFIVQLR